MNQIEFTTKGLYDGVQVLVDGNDLLHQLGAQNFFKYMPPGYLLSCIHKDEDYIEEFEDLLDGDDKTVVLICNCGMSQCDFMYVDLKQTEDTITWANFKSYSGVSYYLQEPLTFGRKDFESKLLNLKKQFSL